MRLVSKIIFLLFTASLLFACGEEEYPAAGECAAEEAQEQKGSDFKFLTLGLLPGDRKVLHDRIAKRFDLMLEQGFLDEVKCLMAMPQFNRDWPSMRAVGYRQAIDYLLGEIDHDRFMIAGVAATRQLAKRQMTWMRSMDDIHLMDPLTENVVEKALALIREAQSQ